MTGNPEKIINITAMAKKRGEKIINKKNAARR